MVPSLLRVQVMGDSSPAADKLMRSQGVRALPSFHFVRPSALPIRICSDSWQEASPLYRLVCTCGPVAVEEQEAN